MIAVNTPQEFIAACQGPEADILLQNNISVPDFTIGNQMRRLRLTADHYRWVKCLMYNAKNAYLYLNNVSLITNPAAYFGIWLATTTDGHSVVEVEGDNNFSGNLWQLGNQTRICGKGRLRVSCDFIYIDGKELILNCAEVYTAPSKRPIWVRNSQGILRVKDCRLSAGCKTAAPAIDLGVANARTGGTLIAENATVIAKGGSGFPGIGVGYDCACQMKLTNSSLTAVGGKGCSQGLDSRVNFYADNSLLTLQGGKAQ